MFLEVYCFFIRIIYILFTSLQFINFIKSSHNPQLTPDHWAPRMGNRVPAPLAVVAAAAVQS